LRGFNDFLFIHPEISEKWDDERNGTLRPSDVVFGSHRGCWWKCKLGHSWKVSALSRHLGSGCPYCAGNRVWSDFNDLTTVSPWLLKSWDYRLNAVAPSHVMPFTNQKFWWVCENGHHWRSSPTAVKKAWDVLFAEGFFLLAEGLSLKISQLEQAVFPYGESACSFTKKRNDYRNACS